MIESAETEIISLSNSKTIIRFSCEYPEDNLAHVTEDVTAALEYVGCFKNIKNTNPI